MSSGPVFLNLAGHDAVLLVIFQLQAAAAVGLVDGLLHRLRNGIGIHDDLAVNVTGGTAGRLGK